VDALLAALAAFGLVFLAELGDRTQFVLFALATRFPKWPLFLGAAGAFFLQTLLAVLIGERFGAWLPLEVVLLVGAAVFLVLGTLTLYGAVRWRPEGDEEQAPPSKRGAFLTAFLFVLIAELGDKTQIAAATLSATLGHPVAVFTGSFLALLAGAALALLLGGIIATRLPARTVRFIAAAAFLLAGILMIVLAF
jgi:Ca2+/H+ antiporter, TMEM165/GDT1 family